MDPEHHIKLKEDISPKMHPPRKIPASFQEKTKKELDKMEKAGVIRKTDNLRICLDPRDLNKAIKREYYQLPTFEEIGSRLSGAKLFTKLGCKKRILTDTT